MPRAFQEPVILRELRADQFIHARVRVPILQSFPPRRHFGVSVVLQVRDDRAIGPRFGVPRVDFRDAVEKRAGLVVFLRVNQMVHQQQHRRRVMRVRLQHRLEIFPHLFRVARGERPRQSELRVRVVGKPGQRVVEGFLRELVIALLQRQFARGEIGVAVIRHHAFDLVVEIIEDEFRVHLHQQQRLTEPDHRGRIQRGAQPRPPPSGTERGEDVADVLQRGVGAVRAAIGLIDVVGFEQERHAGGVAARRADDGGHRLRIFAGGHLRLRQEQGPVLVKRAVVHGLLRLADAFVVLAGLIKLLGVVEAGGVRGAGGGNQKTGEKDTGGHGGPAMKPFQEVHDYF